MEGPFKDPQIADGERTAYRALAGDRELGSGELVVERVSEGGREFSRQSLVARLAGEVEWQAETTFRRRSGTIHAETHRMETRGADAAPIAAEEGRFRGMRAPYFGAELEPFPRDMAPLPGCALALRGLQFEPGCVRGFSVWLANSIYWPVEAKVEKRERIELPAGARDAWRVRVRASFEQVDAALDRMIDMVIPPLVLHFGATPPHPLLRFAFPTGPFKWNPPGLVEATEVA